MNVAIAWSDWQALQIDDLPYIGKLFELRTDTERLNGWAGLELNPDTDVYRYAELGLEGSTDHIVSYEINIGCMCVEDHGRIHPYLDVIADQFRDNSLAYTE